MNLRPELKAAPAYHFSAKNCQIKLDQNESPFQLPDDLQESIWQRLKTLELNRYPELNAYSLRQRLAEHLNWGAEGIVISGGSNVLIQALVIAAGIGQSVLSVSPTFSVYSLQANLLESTLIEKSLDASFNLPMKDLLEALDQHKGVFFLANPAAPTANLLAKNDILKLVEASSKQWLMVIDEAYHQFSQTDYSYLVKDYPHLVCLRTFSKAYGLGGVRLGYGLMQNRLASQLQKAIMPFSVSALQLAIAETVLEHSDYVSEHVATILKERERVFAALQSFPEINVYPSATNFLLFRVQNAQQVYNGLLEQGILIRRQDHLAQLEGCLRVSIGTADENNSFLDALHTTLTKGVRYA